MRHLVPIALSLALVAATPGQVPEPAGLWQGTMHGYTPNTLQGARVLDTAALTKLVAEKHPILLDVADADKKPENLPKTALWMPAHRSLPGAVWMPGASSGTDDPRFADAFKTRIAELTGGDRAKPIVSFCHPECWGSWNVGKRLVALGYTNVFWYPEGMEGWQAEHDTTFVKADAKWASGDATKATR